MSVAAPPRPTLPPEPEALFEEARRHRRARRLRLLLAALIVAGGAGGGAYWGFGGGSAHTASLPQIQAAVSHRLASSKRLILEVTTTRQGPPANGRTGETWTDLATGSRRSVDFGTGGRPIVAFASSFTRDKRQPTVADLVQTIVSYDSRSATQLKMHMPLTFARWATRIADPFATNLHFRVLGTATVDGQDTYHLRADYKTRPARVGVHAPTRQDVWISTADHRLVQTQMSNASTVFQTTDFHWLPRTSANLAKVHLAIPPGFTHELRARVNTLPATVPTPPARPLQVTSDNGVSVTAGANGVILFDTTKADSAVRKAFAPGRASYTCFKIKSNGRFSTVVTGERSGAFAPRVAFELTTRAPFDGCTLAGAGYGWRWPLRFGGHDPVELAFTAVAGRYFADRAAARELADFVRSRKTHEIRRLPASAIASALHAAYKHLVIELPSPTAPVRPGVIGYAVTGSGVVFSSRSTTGRRFSVDIAHGRIAKQNVKPLGYVF